MDLIGQLSNPVGPLKALLEGHWGQGGAAKASRRSLARSSSADRGVDVRHRRVGWAVEAIVRVLAERGEPMQAKEVHQAVEALLGRSVHWGTIKGALASNASGRSPRFVRLARGRYALRSPSTT